MADNFDMKQFLVENKLGAYSKLKNEGEAAYEYEKGKAAGEKLAKEDMGHDIEDAEAMKQMDFLAEYEVIYVYGEDGKCYRKDDEGNYDQVDRSYCQRYAGSGVREEKEEEGYMGTQYDSSEDMAVDMLKKGITEKETEEAFGGVNERLAPHVFSRMAGLSSYKAQMAMIKAAEVMMRELVDEGFEVEEIREYFNQLIANDI